VKLSEIKLKVRDNLTKKLKLRIKESATILDCQTQKENKTLSSACSFTGLVHEPKSRRRLNNLRQQIKVCAQILQEQIIQEQNKQIDLIKRRRRRRREEMRR